VRSEEALELFTNFSGEVSHYRRLEVLPDFD